MADEKPGSLSRTENLALFPQKDPFLFMDELLEVSASHAVGRRVFRADEFFYKGHFPGHPVTPGVILLEMICQASQAPAIVRLHEEGRLSGGKAIVGYFTNAAFEVFERVLPGTEVFVHSELVTWRLGRLRAKGRLYDATGKVFATAEHGAMIVVR